MVRGEHKPRLWLVCFTNGDGHAWWDRLLRPGFRHVCAASYYADVGAWVLVDSTRTGLVVEVVPPDGFDGRMAQLVRDSAAILRVPSAEGRSRAEFHAGWCVGTVKSLLGLNSRALAPFGLYRHLLAIGAEVVEIPRLDEPVQDAQRPEGRPGDHCPA